jgi:hypothetical protein
VKGGVGRLQKQVIPQEDFFKTLEKVKEFDQDMYLYLYLLYSTGCRSAALREVKFDDFKLQVIFHFNIFSLMGKLRCTSMSKKPTKASSEQSLQSYITICKRKKGGEYLW